MKKDGRIRCAAADLGAGSGRVIVGEIIHERLELAEVYRFDDLLHEDHSSGYLCWNLDEIEHHVRAGISAASSAPTSSIGVDGWGVDYVLLDDAYRRVGCSVGYRDSRTEGMVDRVLARIPREQVYRRTGIQFQSFNTLYQLAATAIQEPAWIRDARHLLMVPDYLHYRLSGVVSNEYTNATTTQLFNLAGEWDTGLLAAAGVDRLLMGKPINPGTVLGPLTTHDGASNDMLVIVPATHDTASAVAAAPLESADEAYISSGTWSLMGIESLSPFTTDDAMNMNFSNEGGVERRYRVLKNIMGLWLIQRVSLELNITIDDKLIEAASRATPWRSIVNPDDKRFLNPSSMSRSIREYCAETGQPEPETAAELARCVFDSLALCYRTVKGELETLLGHRLTKIRIIGGGSKNKLLNQLCADACGIPVSAGPAETSAIGNLCVQLITLGALENLEDARRLVRRSFPITEYVPQAIVPDTVWKRFQQIIIPRTQEIVLP
jgi:rhamnulokinase